MTAVIPPSARIPEELYQQITALIPIPCVDLVIVRGGKEEPEILLINRAIDPEKGKWCVVGGRVIGGREVPAERLKGAIQRQAEIELGIKVKVIPPWNANHPAVIFDEPCDPAKYPIILVYPVEIVEGDVRTGPESSEARWFRYGELPAIMGFNGRAEIDAVVRELFRTGALADLC